MRSPEKLGLALAASSGAGYALAFPPFAVPGAGAVVLVLLFAAVARLRPAAAAAAGLGWALVATLSVAAWLPAAVGRFFEVPDLVGWLGLAGLGVTSVGLPMAALCAWISWGTRRGVAGPLGVAAAFGLAEFARTHAWPGPPLPWALLGASPLPGALVESVDAIGVFGLGMLAAGVNAALAALAVPALRTRRAALEGAALALLLAASWSYGRHEAQRDFGEGEPLVVAAVQAGTQPAGPLVLTRGLEGRGVSLVVWPEHAFGGYLRERTPASDAVRALSRELRADLLLGGPHFRYGEPAPHYFSSAFLLRGGELVGRHDKTRLVPFAEAGYEPGERPRVLEAAHARLGALVCAEILFPSVARELARSGAEILAHPSNDARLAPAAAEHLLHLAALRAIENRRPLVRATGDGLSAVIDPHGRLLARSAFGAEEVALARVRASRSVTWTQRFGDWPVGLALLGVAAVTVRGTFRRIHA